MLTNLQENSKPKKLQVRKKVLDWLPIQYEEYYQATDLVYKFCLKLFGQLEAAKRDNFPEVTMRQWFIEFIKAGWTKGMVLKRYEGVLRSEKYGAIDFNDWVKAVPVFAEDEMLIIVKQRIDAIIQRGKYLLSIIDKPIKLTEEEKQAVEVIITKDLEFELRNEKFRIIDEYRSTRKEELRKIKSNLKEKFE